MKVFIGVLEVDEDIHKLESRIDKILSREKPDDIVLIVGEDAAIHTLAVAELHMFEYRNVLYASWSVLEDVIYRLEHDFDYRIIVHPVEGEYRCRETGFRGVYEGHVDIEPYLYMELSKYFTSHVGAELDIKLYYEDGYRGRIVEKVLSDIVSVENILSGMWSFRYVGEPYIEWRSIKPSSLDKDLDVDEYRRLRAASQAFNYGLYHRMYKFLGDSNIVNKYINEINLEFVRNTVSDREEYVLNVVHNSYIPRIAIPLSKLNIAVRAAVEGGEAIDDEASPIFRISRECGKTPEEVLYDLVD